MNACINQPHLILQSHKRSSKRRPLNILSTSHDFFSERGDIYVEYQKKEWGCQGGKLYGRKWRRPLIWLLTYLTGLYLSVAAVRVETITIYWLETMLLRRPDPGDASAGRLTLLGPPNPDRSNRHAFFLFCQECQQITKAWYFLCSTSFLIVFIYLIVNNNNLLVATSMTYYRDILAVQNLWTTVLHVLI